MERRSIKLQALGNAAYRGEEETQWLSQTHSTRKLLSPEWEEDDELDALLALVSDRTTNFDARNLFFRSR